MEGERKTGESAIIISEIFNFKKKSAIFRVEAFRVLWKTINLI